MTSPQPSSSSRPERRIEVTVVYEKLLASQKPVVVSLGGARSSKSHSLAQIYAQRFHNRRHRKVLITRKTLPSLKLTAMRLMVGLLQDFGLYRRYDHNKSEGTIYDPRNNNLLAFLSIDDPEKIKSTEWNDVWMEEASEFTWEDFTVIRTRMSGPTTAEEPNQIHLSLNPTEEQGWINQRLILDPAFADEVDVVRSTWRDNPFLSPEYIKILNQLKDQDRAAWQVFSEGEWGTLTNIIYSAYEMVPKMPDSFDEIIYGIDFGFNNPSAIIQIGIKDQRHYLKQLLYETGLTNADLIAKAEGLIPKDLRFSPTYCDAAEPDRIAEFERAGFNVFPADKEVKAGIDFCKRIKFFATTDSSDLVKERGSYKWKSDRNGNVLDEPVKFMDHLMDAKRYALYTHFKDRVNTAGYA